MGRVANRIAKATFLDRDGNTVALDPNTAEGNSLHGGHRTGQNPSSWGHHRWATTEKDPEPNDHHPPQNSASFTFTSPEGHGGYPGQVTATATYVVLPPPASTHASTTSLDEAVSRICPGVTVVSGASTSARSGAGDGTDGVTLTGALRVTLTCRGATKVTPVNLVHHSYFNLAGHDSGRTVYDHEIHLPATHITDVGAGLVPTGQLRDVRGTPLDFTRGLTLLSSVQSELDVHLGDGFRGLDHNFVVWGGGDGGGGGGGRGGEGEVGGGGGGGAAALTTTAAKNNTKNNNNDKLSMRWHGTLRDPSSGRIVYIYSNQPGLQAYAGGFLDGVVGKGGAIYDAYGGLALEPQAWPDAVHHDHFPNIMLGVGDEYINDTLFVFGA